MIPSDGNRAARGPALAVLLLALAARSVFVFSPPPGALFSDMREYHEKALAVLGRGSYGHADRPPLYPFFLAALYRVAGDGRRPLACAQAAMGALVALFSFGIARRLAGPRAGAAAGLITACYPGLAVYAGLVMSENLFIFLLMAALRILARDRPPGPAACAGAGALLGLACLTRSLLAAFLPLAALAVWMGGGKRGGAALLAAAFCVIAPWTARNRLHYGCFVPIDTYGGYNFLFGNNPDADGRQEPAVIRKLAETTLREWRIEREKGAPPEVVICPGGSAAGYREGMRFIAEHPRRAIRLAARKLGYLYGPEIRELSWGYSMGYFGAVPRRVLVPAAAAVVAAFPVLCLLALGGICFRGGGPEASRAGWGLLSLAILYLSAVHAVTFAESRFHLPFVPILAVYAGRLAGPAARRGPLRLAVFAAVAAVLAYGWSVRAGEEWGRVETALGPGGEAARLDY